MRLEVTRKSDIAIRSLIALANQTNRRKTAELAALIDAAPAFVAQAVNPLVKRNWVDSVPGPTGGYRLLADPNELSVLDVIEAVEGPTNADYCVVSSSPCGENGFCALHDAWDAARDVLLGHLRSTSVAFVASAALAPTNQPRQKDVDQ